MNYLGLYLRNSLRKGVAEQHKWKSSSVCRKNASVLERNRQMAPVILLAGYLLESLS